MRVALNVDSAFWRAGRGNLSGSVPFQGARSDPVPMEMGNAQHRSEKFTKGQREQRKMNLAIGAGFTCHKVGWRSWKHLPQASNVQVEDSNDEVRDANLSDSKSGEE